MTHADIRKESGINVLRYLVFALIWSLCCMIGAPLIFYSIADVEVTLFPPLTQQKITRPHLKADDPNYLLWSWSFYKNRYSVPEFVSFMAYLPDKPWTRIPVEVFTDWNCTRNFQTDRTTSKGDYITKEMCARLPAQWAGRKDVQIDGFAAYSTLHGLYTLPVKIPPTSDAWRQVD